jgi:hypothetical protein
MPRYEEQYRIFDSDGIWIDQVLTSVERSWALVTETSARFILSIYDPKCNPFTIKYGNVLLIENSDGLPDWVGMIDGIHFDSGFCIVDAYTPERYFFYRRGPRRLTLKGRAGELFAQMIQYINGLEKTVLEVGNISTNTTSMEETLNPVVLTNNLNRVVARSGEGYRWRPVVEKGKLTVFADWFPTIVLETGLILQDGYNITGQHPLQGVPPINDFLAYGLGADWEARTLSIAQDVESRNEYGLRQASIPVNTKVPAVLETTSRTQLVKFRLPQYTFPIEALNVDDTFARLEPGALATFTQLVGQGFSGNETGYLSYNKVIKSMVFNPAVGSVSLAI